jgi:cell wall-associated NlpC family hydrolase
MVRQLAAVLLSCTLFSVVLLTSSPSEAYAQGYDVSGQAVVEDAQSYIGSPYGWGMDCSGFTSMVFADLGVYLPDSYGKAGDLVFFDEAGYGISHVGIATGYGTVIHASTYYGAVVETPIEYIPGYVGAVDAY